MATVLAIPDLHCPAHHRDALAFLRAVKRLHRPDKIVCLGDEIDSHAVSEHDPDPDGLSPGDELAEGLRCLTPFYELFPDTQVCESNHTSRGYRKAFKHGLPRAYLRTYAEFMRAPEGWTWHSSIEIDGVIYFHGEGYSGREGAIKAAMANMQSTVCGHLHSHAGVLFYANAKHLIYGFNVGALVDRHHYAMKYAAKTAAKPVLGCGIIRNGIPTFLPMVLNSRGRWTGKL